jgi:hypothetical protein
MVCKAVSMNRILRAAMGFVWVVIPLGYATCGGDKPPTEPAASGESQYFPQIFLS